MRNANANVKIENLYNISDVIKVFLKIKKLSINLDLLQETIMKMKTKTVLTYYFDNGGIKNDLQREKISFTLHLEKYKTDVDKKAFRRYNESCVVYKKRKQHNTNSFFLLLKVFLKCYPRYPNVYGELENITYQKKS